MFIVMHCMGMPFNGTTIKSQSLGGSESAAYYLARELARAGHRVTLFTNTEEQGEWDGVRYLSNGPPSEEMPLGRNFHFYAANTPHDVCIIQRHPLAFRQRWASKVNLWWLHDLALYRHADMVSSMLWNVDGILTVSEYHKQQVCKVYDVDPAIVHPITNGVDLSLFETEGLFPVQQGKFNLAYSSRPERGLVHLVRKGGIMDRLGDEYHLYVCGYDNTTPQMADFYNMLWQRCEEMSNVTNLGSLTKTELAQLFKSCDMLAYPTVFEEVSCITAMEAMAAGLPMISSRWAALPETCGVGAKLLRVKGDEANPQVDEAKFVEHIQQYARNPERLRPMKKAQLERANIYSWSNAGQRLENVIVSQFGRDTELARYNQLLHLSDYYAMQRLNLITVEQTDLGCWMLDRHEPCYAFARDNTFDEHYARYYQYEKDRGVDYGPENLDGNTRFECVSDLVADLDADVCVLDYGCAHGHYTVNLAKRFPEIKFVGVDLAESNIAIAREWAESESVSNVEFFWGDAASEVSNPNWQGKEFALIIAAEVLEHVADPIGLTDNLLSLLNPEGLICITTPYGPWEAQEYDRHYPWRAHLWHFEREDLHDIWGQFPGFDIKALPVGPGKDGQIMGSYLTTFRPGGTAGSINYDRKLGTLVGKQTVSLCMIVRDGMHSIGTAIESALPAVDEVIVAIDNQTSDGTVDVLQHLCTDRPGKRFHWFDIESPLEQGFAAARNESISKASGDWILWLDADEILANPQNIFKYLRHNGYSGYAIPQHHFSIDPGEKIKTDLPVRLFRNNIGIKFSGFVHEHPENENLKKNQGVGKATMLGDVSIGHTGYQTEAIRRKRFSRNFELMKREIDHNPDRTLTQVLWVRDVAHLLGYCSQQGQSPGQDLLNMAEEAVEMWHKLLDAEQGLRYATESLPYYSVLVDTIKPGDGIDCVLALEAGHGPASVKSQPNIVNGLFLNKQHAKDYIALLAKEKLKHLDSRYF